MKIKKQRHEKRRKEKKYKHPSFGMLNISRIHGKIWIFIWH
nr:MAG TPA: hypothetical protein [Caudoviricetes sp.]